MTTVTLTPIDRMRPVVEAFQQSASFRSLNDHMIAMAQAGLTMLASYMRRPGEPQVHVEVGATPDLPVTLWSSESNRVTITSQLEDPNALFHRLASACRDLGEAAEQALCWRTGGETIATRSASAAVLRPKSCTCT